MKAFMARVSQGAQEGVKTSRLLKYVDSAFDPPRKPRLYSQPIPHAISPQQSWDPWPMTDVLLAHAFFLKNDPKQVEKMRPYAPLGTLYAASYLRSRGYSVALFDAMLA